jgi:hypothetical protein
MGFVNEDLVLSEAQDSQVLPSSFLLVDPTGSSKSLEDEDGLL